MNQTSKQHLKWNQLRKKKITFSILEELLTQTPPLPISKDLSCTWQQAQIWFLNPRTIFFLFAVHFSAFMVHSWPTSKKFIQIPKPIFFFLHFWPHTDSVTQCKCFKYFQGQVLDIFGATWDHIGEHLWKQASLVDKSSQDTSQLPSEDTAGFKDNSASTLNTLVKYLTLHALPLCPSVQGKSRRVTLWLPIFPSSSSQAIPVCPNWNSSPSCCPPGPRHRILDVIQQWSLAESQISAWPVPFPLLLVLDAHPEVDVPAALEFPLPKIKVCSCSFPLLLSAGCWDTTLSWF